MPPAGIEPATYRLLTTSAFAALAVCGLDFAFNRSGCSSSSLYTFPCGLGSALPVKGSPNLGRFTCTFLHKSSIESRMLYHLSYRGVFTCTVLIITLRFFMSIYFLLLLVTHSNKEAINSSRKLRFICSWASLILLNIITSPPVSGWCCMANFL